MFRQRRTYQRYAQAVLQTNKQNRKPETEVHIQSSDGFEAIPEGRRDREFGELLKGDGRGRGGKNGHPPCPRLELNLPHTESDL